jgi:glucose-1-phosphate thymidylyltransferase
MKGLILSGGAGTRLRPITHTSAKQLVPVANKPILFFGIEDMVEAGITEIGIITGETGPEIRAAVGDGSDFGAKITYIPQESPLGLAHCVLIARDFLGDDDFVMYLGDNLLRQGISEFVESFDADHSASAGVDRQVSSAQILLARVPDPQRFGVAEISASGEVTQLVEKPENPKSDLALVGVYLFDRTIHQAVAAIEPSPRGELEITDAIQWLIDNGHRVRHEVLEGWWKDTGKLEPLLEGNRLVLDMFETSIEGSVDRSSVLEGMVIVQAGAEVINSTLRGPVIIGEGTRIIDSVVGPYASIYFDCTIVDSSIENSVILEETKIVGVKNISESLVGKQVDIHRASSDPAVRLMIGDHSVVELP